MWKAWLSRLSKVFQGFKDFCLFDVVKRVWQTGNPEHPPVFQYKDKSKIGWLDSYVIKLPSGEIVVVYNDVTDRKQAEEEKNSRMKKKSVKTI